MTNHSGSVRREGLSLTLPIKANPSIADGMFAMWSTHGLLGLTARGGSLDILQQGALLNIAP
eukprot:5200436-Prymnesium_polylepis.2